MSPDRIDLNAPLPAEWSLSGLSDPKSDGVNLFRTVIQPKSEIVFHSNSPKYILLRFQLFSTTSEVTAQVYLNDTFLGKTVFPRNRYTDVAEMGGFTRLGRNIVSIDYQCQDRNCTAPIYQYWTGLDFRPPVTLNVSEKIGFTAQRWKLDVPGTPLEISGATPLLFDGANYFRQIKGRTFRLSWPEHVRPINVTFQVEAAEPVKVTSRVAGRVVSVVQGNGRQGVSPAVSLLSFDKVRTLDVEIQCLKSGLGCATLHFPYVTVLPDQTHLPRDEWTAILVASFILLALGSLLGLRRVQLQAVSSKDENGG